MAQAPLEQIGESEQTGTLVRFYPSASTFSSVEIKYDILLHRLKELAFLNSGVNIAIKENLTEKSDNFLYKGGIKSYVEYLNKNKTTIHKDVIYIKGKHESIELEAALQWTKSYQERIYPFTNNIPQKDGGTHVSGFKIFADKSL